MHLFCIGSVLVFLSFNMMMMVCFLTFYKFTDEKTLPRVVDFFLIRFSVHKRRLHQIQGMKFTHKLMAISRREKNKQTNQPTNQPTTSRILQQKECNYTLFVFITYTIVTTAHDGWAEHSLPCKHKLIDQTSLGRFGGVGGGRGWIPQQWRKCLTLHTTDKWHFCKVMRRRRVVVRGKGGGGMIPQQWSRCLILYTTDICVIPSRN